MFSPPIRSLEERFWPKVKKGEENECWEWQAGKNKKGYGQIRPNHKDNEVLAHRVAWELANGPIPDGLCVLHHCDNPKCCNVRHLFLGTRGDNLHDMISKGRTDYFGKAGADNHMAVFTEDEVREIRASPLSVTELVAQYKRPYSTIYQIVTNKRWRNLA